MDFSTIDIAVFALYALIILSIGLFDTLREELPLRGVLQCSKCQSKMTGSPSKSSTGRKYFY